MGETMPSRAALLWRLHSHAIKNAVKPLQETFEIRKTSASAITSGKSSLRAFDQRSVVW